MKDVPQIADNFGRRFPYLRLSVTDVCNFRCSYCLPDGYKKTGCESYMSPEEMFRLVTAFAGLGAWKIRLTGGEPTVRPDFIEIARGISKIPGIQKLAFTTNGYRLPEHHLPGTYVTERLLQRGWSLKPREDGAGPAQEFESSDSMGTIGLIAPYSKDFCKTCNRLRVSAKGNLHLCLFGEGGYRQMPAKRPAAMICKYRLSLVQYCLCGRERPHKP